MDGNIIFYILYQHPLYVFHQLDGLSNFVKSLANVTIKASQETFPFETLLCFHTLRLQLFEAFYIYDNI